MGAVFVKSNLKIYYYGNYLNYSVSYFFPSSSQVKPLGINNPSWVVFVKPKNFDTMKKYNGPSIRNVETSTGKIPDNVGFPGNMDGLTRRLTHSDLAQQRRNLRAMQGQKF